jgi:cysteine desulfurase family protein (TIGR01976 family)
MMAMTQLAYTGSAPDHSVADIRRAFPALRRTHRGQPVAFFDAPGGTQVPDMVLEAMHEYLTTHNANTHWSYPTSAETDAIIGAARASMAMLLNAAPDEIAFGPNMTTLTYHVSRALGRRLGKGDTIVITELDHHANIDPWRALAVERGVTVRQVPLNPESGTLDRPALENAFDSSVALLAIGAASNALGTINDLQAAIALARGAGALVFVDAVAYAPHALIDVRLLDCDFLVCSPYKFYGPHLGVLYGKRDVLAGLDVPKLEPAPDGPAERFELGTQGHEAIAGAAAAVRYLTSLAPGVEGRDALATVFTALHARGQELISRLLGGLADIRGVRLFGVPASGRRTPTVAFTLAGHDSEAVARALADEAVFVSHGDFYALTVVRRLGLEREGLVRAGCACYTTEEEVDRLLTAVATIR